MNIPMPTPEEKSKSYDFIVKKAYTQTFTKKLYHTAKTLGFRNLWIGVEWCVIVPTLCSLVYLMTTIPDFIEKMEYTPTELFLIAPLFYGSLLFLSLWKEKEDGVYPLKQPCFFSTAQLTSLRCLCFGGISALLQVITLCLVVISGGEVALSSLLLSFALLLLYGGLSLFTLRRTETLIAHGFTLGLWSLLTLCITFLPENKGNIAELISSIGYGFLLFFLIPSLLFLFTQFKKYFLQGELSC